MRGSREGWIKCESLHTIMKTFDEAGTRDDPRVPAHKSSRRIAARGFLQTSDRRYSRQTAAASAAGPQCGFGEGELEEGARSAHRVSDACCCRSRR